MTHTVTSDTLNGAVEFDAPFHVHDDRRTITDHTGLYAPDVYDDPDGDVTVDGNDWEALTGHTGQYGYSGAVMHESETLSGGLAERILSEGGTYVVVVVEQNTNHLDPDSDYDEIIDARNNPAGWAVLRYTGGDK